MGALGIRAAAAKKLLRELGRSPFYEKVYLLSGLSAPHETSYFYTDPDAVCLQLWAVSILIDFFFVEEKRAVSHFSEVMFH